MLLSWFLSLATVAISVLVWIPSGGSLEPYDLFPLFGLVAFGLMWAHYVSGALRTWQHVDEDALRRHFQITSGAVLFCILVHPFLIELQLYLDGFGIPPSSFLQVYPGTVDRLALLAGATALVCFLAFELHRYFAERSWWKYVEWANIAAMVLILWHGFVLGGELRTPWFQLVWATYAVTFALSVAYTGYHKRRTKHGT